MQIFCNEQKHLDKKGVKTSKGLAWYTNIAEVSLSWNITMAVVRSCESALYYINTNEIPGELSRENLISSRVKISPLLWLHNRSSLSHQKTIKVKWFGSSLVCI